MTACRERGGNLVRVGVWILVSLAIAGCGARAGRSVGQPSPTPAQAPSPSSPSLSQAPPALSQAPPSPSLSEFIAKARALAAEARPPARPAMPSVEAAYPRLAAALHAANTAPSPQTLRRAADEYRRLRIADRAHDYLQQALRLDPRDAATYDALARLWRDGGLPALALADAHRAVHYAPASAVAHNTLGTV